MSDPAHLDLHVCRGKSHTTVIEATGELDLGSCDCLRDQLLSTLEQGTVILDVTHVGFCDAAGVQALLEAQRAARRVGGTFRLAGPTYAVGRVLKLAGASDEFEIFPDVDTALKD